MSNAIVVPNPSPGPIIYPDSDGKRMSDNTKQFDWIVSWKLNLDAYFLDDPNVVVFGDLLWYPVEGDPTIRQAPDVMVVFGRPKGYRGSYMQWREDHIVPQVAVEILSPNNTAKEMKRKLGFYEQYGIEEYYVYDPDTFELKGYLRRDGRLEEVPQMDGFRSPRLNIRYDLSEGELRIFGPDDKIFQSHSELKIQRDELEASAKNADRARKKAEAAKNQAEAAKNQAEAAKNQAEAERDEAVRRAEELSALLRKMGVDPATGGRA